MPELLISKNDLFLFRYPLSKTALKMGRGSQCDVILANDSISREQLLLYPFEGSFFLKNVGQAEITLNGKSIKSSPFQKGDVVQIHDFKIELNDQNDEDWSDAATLVTSARGESTQAIHASYLKGKIIQEALQLKIQEPDRPERHFSIMNEVSLIGKGPHCDLRLEDSFCSDQHGKLIVKNGKVTWLDLNSTNGSYVKGVQVREATLEEGMTLRIGKTDLSLVTQVEEKKVEALPLQSFGPIVGASPAMQQLYGLLQQVAPSDASVCVFGETGSGKELVARSLHELSPRKLKPLVTINCGAISRELIESELFGHEKGAFTGAHQQHKGVFEQAQGGTLFLDEIGELPLDLQPALLRVLETGKLRRVGASQEVSVDVRVVCATHRDLSQLVAEGKFREDLFFRLYVFPVFLPPLRDRREDIPLIATHFLKMISPSNKTFEFTEGALAYLKDQTWTGNVRELKNVIQRALILAKSTVIDESLLQLPRPISSNESVSHVSSAKNFQELEKQLILRELKNQNGNKQATARALGIAKSTLYEKIKIYGIEL